MRPQGAARRVVANPGSADPSESDRTKVYSKIGHPYGTTVVGLLQPSQTLLPVVQSSVDLGDSVGQYVVLAGHFLELGDQAARLRLAPRRSIGDCDLRQVEWAISREPGGGLEFGQRILGLASQQILAED